MAFNCSILKTEVKKPCNLKKCNFNITSKSAKNCLFLYQCVDDLTLEEIAHLYKWPFKDVRSTYHSAVEKVFDRLVEDYIEDKDTIRYKKGFKVSCFSGQPVKFSVIFHDSYMIDRSEIIYSYKVMEKAIYHQITPIQVIKICLKLFKDNKLMDGFLGLPTGTSKKLRSEI